MGHLQGKTVSGRRTVLRTGGGRGEVPSLGVRGETWPARKCPGPGLLRVVSSSPGRYCGNYSRKTPSVTLKWWDPTDNSEAKDQPLFCIDFRSVVFVSWGQWKTIPSWRGDGIRKGNLLSECVATSEQIKYRHEAPLL